MSTPAQRARRRQRALALVRGLKLSAHCAVCGTPGPLTAHHLVPARKRFKIARAARYGLPAVRAELAKCCWACRPCHDGIHAGAVDAAGLAPLEIPAEALQDVTA